MFMFDESHSVSLPVNKSALESCAKVRNLALSLSRRFSPCVCFGRQINLSTIIWEWLVISQLYSKVKPLQKLGKS